MVASGSSSSLARTPSKSCARFVTSVGFAYSSVGLFVFFVGFVYSVLWFAYNRSHRGFPVNIFLACIFNGLGAVGVL